MTRLKTLGAIGIATLAVCALLVPTSVSAKKQVTRPMYLSGSGMLGWDGGVNWWAAESGQATHLGRYVLQESGNCASDLSVWEGEGTFTTANDDSLNFTVKGMCVGYEQIGWMRFTGGTGQFVGASGSVDLVWVTDETGAYTISGTGTITY